MYYAVVDALDEIGADSSNVQIAYHTPNFVLDGYTITAANAEDGTVEVYASNGETPTPHISTMTVSGSSVMKLLPARIRIG